MRALQYPLSVIDGPPGTGKTQTILNIIASVICRPGATVGD
jgi:DNA polymerase III delta prime subunit